jgi:hypothetical protein
MTIVDKPVKTYKPIRVEPQAADKLLQTRAALGLNMTETILYLIEHLPTNKRKPQLPQYPK